ncbi:hypothetical protein C449_15968 [Halococcus saccharolyticus DSM 5350]|uniref:Uncharacterized protein n=1 Tax=Halococcus saccharolyticus DSM 5350 TaxID=1227455 RepID=M0MDC2_9EURY|nr:hypothetical protein C449_15968 [Halococcus saccharolyticus DSM 5350]
MLLNGIYTATSGGDYWKSGLEVTPNTTDTSSIYVDVSNGTINVGGEDVSLPSQKVELDPATNNPRIDVIEATANGVGVVKGNEAPKRPTDAEDGQEGTFPNIWQPAPDDGTLVGGVLRAIVYVRPSVSDSTGITAQDIRNYDVQGISGDFVAQTNLQPSIEALDVDLADPLDTTVENSQNLGGTFHNQFRRNYLTIQVPGKSETIPGTDNADDPQRSFLTVPPDHRFVVWRSSINSNQAVVENDISAEIVRDTGSGQVSVYSTGQSVDYDTNGTGNIAVADPQNDSYRLVFRFQNSNAADSSNRYTATFRCSLNNAEIDP